MYHDQGHGPVKVMGIDDGINITVGLPLIRTSVDHGTAFDIAGKGIANPCGMIGSIAMLLRHSLNLNEEANIVEKAMHDVIESGARTQDIAHNDDKILNTKEMTQLIIDKIN